MRVGFVNTCNAWNFKPFNVDPLSSILLLTILEEEFGDRLELSYTDLRGVTVDNRIFHIPEKDVYLHYVTTPDMEEIKSIINKIREFYPKSLHIAGGPHTSIFTEQSEEIFDAICLGDGEEIIKQIIKDILNKSLKKIYKNTGVNDINQYPFPLRKYLPKSATARKGFFSKKKLDVTGTTASFSRHCPFACHFCSNIDFGPTQTRSPYWIKQEIEYLKKEYGIESLLLKSDNGIPVEKSQAIPKLKAIGECNVTWRGQIRAQGIPAEVLELARDSGCEELSIAVESVCQRSLDIINKRTDLSKVKLFLKTLKKTGIDVKLLLILGLPGEPKDIVKKTIEFIEEVEPSNIVLTKLCPMPGSEIYNNPDKFSMIINRDIPFEKYRFEWGRFDENEKAPLYFSYKETTPWGSGMTAQELQDNYTSLQTWLRERRINF